MLLYTVLPPLPPSPRSPAEGREQLPEGGAEGCPGEARAGPTELLAGAGAGGHAAGEPPVGLLGASMTSRRVLSMLL